MALEATVTKENFILFKMWNYEITLVLGKNTTTLEIFWPGVKNIKEAKWKPKERDTHCTGHVVFGIFCVKFLLLLLVWELLEGSFYPGFCTALHIGCCSVNTGWLNCTTEDICCRWGFWLAAGSDTCCDTQVIQKMIFPKVCRNSLPAGANHLTH
jgi:hypothetical protein